MYIFDLNRDISYQFCSDKWLAVEEDDGLIERRMQVATAEEKKAFVRLFTTKIGRGFTEKHLWISVLTKPIYSQFSRVQRLTCCFCLLFFTMLTSAMFFSFGDGPNPYVLKIGSLEFNYRGVIVGVQSSMISIIPTTIVLYIFQNARDRPSKKKKFSGEDLSSSSGVLFKPPKKPKGLHHRWRILAWFLAFGMFSSAFIVCLFYSMMWGDAKSKQWVAAITTGLFNSVIIVQPANIIIVSVLIAIILNDNAKEDNLILEEYTMVELDVQYADDIKEKSRKLPLAEDARK